MGFVGGLLLLLTLSRSVLVWDCWIRVGTLLTVLETLLVILVNRA
jgi:hypothetical protein